MIANMLIPLFYLREFLRRQLLNALRGIDFEPKPDVMRGASVGDCLLVTNDLGLGSKLRLGKRPCVLKGNRFFRRRDRSLGELLDE